MYPAIIDVKPLDGYKLLLTFDNREKRVFDLSPYLNEGRFSELKDINVFNSVKVKFDSIEWENQLDLDPELLFKNSVEYDPKRKRGGIYACANNKNTSVQDD